MKESSRFYSSLGLLIFLNIVIKPVWIFAIDRHVQLSVGTEMYGIYFSLLSFSFVLSFLLDGGLTAFFNRQLAANKENFIDKAGSFLFIKIVFSLIYAAIVCGVAYLSGIKKWDILFNVIIIQALTSLFVFLRSIITSQQLFRTDAWLSVLDKGLMIILCGSFFYLPFTSREITIENFLLIQIACTLLAIITTFIILFKKGILFSLSGKPLFNYSLLKPVLPFAIIVLLMSVHYRFAGFLVERMHPNGAYEAGIYAGAFRLLDATTMIGFLVASFLLPYIARQWGRQHDINEVVLTSRHLLMLFSLVIIVTTIFLAPWMQQLLYHNNDEKAIAVLQWCLPALAGYSLVQVYGTVMTATGQVVPFCFIILGAVALNIVLNLLLIPNWGAKGCCIAALISQGFCGITVMLYVQKRAQINIHLRSLLMYIFIAAILCIVYFYCTDIVSNKWLLIAAAALITLVLAIIFKLADIRKWQHILNQNNQ